VGDTSPATPVGARDPEDTGPAPGIAHVRTPAPRRPHGQGAVVAAVSAGGAVGACARYGAGLLWPTAPDAFPWTTLLVNAVGCAVMGAFLTLLTEGRAAHRLVRPFLGTGVLGGFTTFSTFAVDTRHLVADGHARTGLGYLLLTPLVALAAVWCAARLTRSVLALRRPAPGEQR
jgi:CrcB protein